MCGWVVVRCAGRVRHARDARECSGRRAWRGRATGGERLAACGAAACAAGAAGYDHRRPRPPSATHTTRSTTTCMQWSLQVKPDSVLSVLSFIWIMIFLCVVKSRALRRSVSNLLCIGYLRFVSCDIGKVGIKESSTNIWNAQCTGIASNEIYGLYNVNSFIVPDVGEEIARC